MMQIRKENNKGKLKVLLLFIGTYTVFTTNMIQTIRGAYLFILKTITSFIIEAPT